MSYRLVAACVACLALAALPGCQKKLSVEKTVNLSSGDVQAVIVDAPKAQQKVKATVSSPEPVDVHVVIESDRAAVQEALMSGKKAPADKVLASKEKAKEDSLSATVPAGKEFAVVLSGANKATSVKLTVKSE